MVVCGQDISDMEWSHHFKTSPLVKAETLEHTHIPHARQVPDGFSPESSKLSTQPSERKKKISSSLDPGSHFHDHSTYNYPTQQQYQPMSSHPVQLPPGHNHKHGSHSIPSSEQDQSFQQQQRLHRNLQQSNQTHQEHERVLSSGGDGSLSIVSPGEGHDYGQRYLFSPQRIQSHPQHLSGSHPHTQYHQQQSISSSRGTTSDAFAVQKLHQTNRRRTTKDKVSKGEREEVWPPDVESAFMKALEVLPKLGRRKVLVNGKPCGRNELIADFIYQQTNKIRDRKQVSSHIQVLKNTRKNEPAFMRLLMDCADGEDDSILETACVSASHSPVSSPHMRHGRAEHASTGDQTAGPPNIASTASTHGFDNPLSPAAADLESSSFRHHNSQYKHRQKSLAFSRISPDDHPFDTNAQSLYQQSVTTPDSAVSLSSEVGLKDHIIFEQPRRTAPPGYTYNSVSMNWPRDLSKSAGASPADLSYPLWPTAFSLYIQFRVDHTRNKHIDGGDQDGSSTGSYSLDSSSPYEIGKVASESMEVHDLARALDLEHHIGTIDIHQLPPEKFPMLYELYERVGCAFLFFKVGMNLNLDLEGTFENTCLFDSGERRALRCSTVIYSFGAKVLESSEVQQASFVDGRFVHSFEFVNQFFDAFLSGIRNLGTLDEVEAALCNLSLLQIYEELEPPMEGSSPLLVMAFDFERGAGTVAPYRIIDGPDILESLVC
ncbi:hypothetical protein BGZ65_006159 [Modicella reniformis]|uniref:TEA domain-containing protein n=1 Tax=Modicella reniformis TaxID=1440133 RepID=A0A9P6INV0_9FUNG|nr:hypothetical protein BGZ65_006159 [Modicella reniformis]